MPRKPESSDKAKSQTKDALETWEWEGGSTAKLGSEALVADIEKLTRLERQVLQCLGAAVVIGWNDLPTEVQRTLFRLASADGGADPARELPARIARFLHDHKDDEGTR